MKSFRQLLASRNHAPKISEAQPEPSRTVPAAESPIVVELFQSQGCSSCPPANEHVLELANTRGFIVLVYHVTHWDRLGWKDTFGDIVFDQRQWDYARALGRTNVFTPQVIIAGHIDGVGSTARDLHALIDKGIESKERVSLKISPSENRESVTITGPQVESSVVNMIVFSRNRINVVITKGENRGTTLPHNNIVRRITQVGTYFGGSQNYHLPKLNDINLQVAIVVQRTSGGRITGATCL